MATSCAVVTIKIGGQGSARRSKTRKSFPLALLHRQLRVETHMTSLPLTHSPHRIFIAEKQPAPERNVCLVSVLEHQELQPTRDLVVEETKELDVPLRLHVHIFLERRGGEAERNFMAGQVLDQPRCPCTPI